MNMRRGEWHAAELKARGYERQAQIDRLAIAEIDRLHKANEDLLKAQQANGSVQSSGHEQLVTQVELLQELRATNSSLATLETRCKSQERELETMRQNAAVVVEELKASLQQSELERAQQQVA